MKNTLICITSSWLIMIFTMTASTAVSPQEIAKMARASTVSLTMNNGQYGSGFFVLPDQIATAHHVVKGTSSGYVSPILVDEKYPIIGISGIDSGNDLVILKVADVQGTPLRIGDSGSVKISDTIHVVGNPDGIEGTVSTDEITNDLGNMFLMSAPISPGSSGGAVLNGRGEVIGVSVGSFPGEKKLNQNLNVAVRSKYLAPLVEKAKAAESLTPLSLDGVTGTHLTWGEFKYAFTLRNQQDWTIDDMHFLVIFKDTDGSIICADQFKEDRSVSAGTVTRISRNLHSGLPLPLRSPVGPGVRHLTKSYEIKIFDFNVSHSKSSLLPLEGVAVRSFAWKKQGDDICDFSYTLQNNLNEDLKGVYVIWVFHDIYGAPIAQHWDFFTHISAMATVHEEGYIPFEVTPPLLGQPRFTFYIQDYSALINDYESSRRKNP